MRRVLVYVWVESSGGDEAVPEILKVIWVSLVVWEGKGKGKVGYVR